LAQRVLAWDRKRVQTGKTPWAMPLKIGTHSVFGMLALRGLAMLRALRPLGSRYATEQALIEQWLAAVVSCTQRHWASGHEVAQCGRLIKGYGSTNERGKDNLLHVVQHLATAGHFATNEARSAAIAAARLAALADEGGKALDQALLQHGAPARPLKEQPIRWMRRRPGQA
jgi:indolepyruvate ferredoxin oxidoreductase beta subunit